MGLFNDCEKYFKTKDLYEVLGTSRNASETELKKAYKKASLLYHPDRVGHDRKEEATSKFQILSKIHCILTDNEKRSVYDETGSVDEENLDLQNKDWSCYWRILFPKVTKSDIDAFMKKYKGSEEELEDLKKCYLQYEGDMNKISESFLGYNVNDEDHYRSILLDLINKKEIPDYPKFTRETKSKREARIKRYKKEADEAEEIENELDASLINAIRQRSDNRQSQFDDMIKNLEAKYSKSGKQKKSK